MKSDVSFSHSLIANLSGLFGLVIFLQELWGQSRLEHTVLTAASAGLAAYLILAIGYAAAQGVLAYEEPPGDSNEESQDVDDRSSSDAETDRPQDVADAQAA